ncbi:hypothetical protein CFBP7900_12900 [Xanthomonas hortorum pv. carotae]|uniref:Uncharacterized protein n=1 Tax=Xanthomonas hortorum pv. carotae TaxID=487904 RepID=A0A6V7CQ16_9XANT|nr:hypothetical protein XHC_3221 [Xanthomonas hortorum pv. carotae str. M081]CAD0319854.1 hypothetical protein CFBP7900_12900 [Xanthomonas hortorum pv. carotae]CAD0319861.1 hypothetical protein CFBP7900_12900 [Xanthomonas hortorum pv. carotae]
MSSAFDRFLAGSDGLAALLRALPSHAPPASMDAWFAQAARTADAERNAATPAQDGLQFEAPSTMAAVFAAAAAQAEQAQAAQRAAVQARLAQGERADQALGTALSASARAWIEQQARIDKAAMRPSVDVPSAADVSIAAEVLLAKDTSMAADLSLAKDASIAADMSASSNEAVDTSGAASRSPSTSASAAQAQAQASTLPALESSTTSNQTSHAAASRRSSRRPRWVPTLAFAASITLAVGIGLQWQASQPTLELPTATTPDTALAEPQKTQQATRDAPQVDRTADSTSDLPALPAPAYAEAPNAAAPSIAALPSRSPLPPLPPAQPSPSPSPAPALAPEPVSASPLTPAAAPAPAAVPAPAAAPPRAAMIAAEPAPSVDAQSIDAQAPAASPPPPAPIAASPADAFVSGSLAATADRSTPAPAPIAPDAASAPASPPSQTSLVERTQTNASVAETPLISRAAPVAGQAAPLRVRNAPTLHLDAYRDASPSSKPAASAAAPDATVYQAKGSMARKPGLLKLSTSPRDWLARYALSADRVPAQIRLRAATADAPEVQSWATQLRDQLKQRGWSTQVDIVQDTHLAADQLRLEPFDTAQ